jgi:glucose-6-phosphate isomerase
VLVNVKNHYTYYENEQEEVRILNAVRNEIKEGSSGYYELPINQYDLLEKIDSCKSDYAHFETVAIIGIGGSSLGTKAIHDALKFRRISKELIFLESSDPLKLSIELKKIRLDRTLFIVISKSGTTIETTSIFKYILSLLHVDNPALVANQLIFISDEGSPLHKLGVKSNVKTFTINKNVGGRFSVLSAVGLVPLAIAGYDVDHLLVGARRLYEDFFIDGYDHHKLVRKAYNYSMKRFNITNNVLFGYSSLLESFGNWYVQLWGESLGKFDNKGNFQGLTPIGIVGPIDQHSFLQLIMEGPKDKSVTFIKVKNFFKHVKIPEISLENLESTNFVNGSSFEELINKQCDATLESLVGADVLVDIIELDELNEATLGYLIYYYELLTSLVGASFNINTYDQPGVEIGKKLLAKKF